MWIGIYVTGSFQDQYELLCELEQMIKDDALTYFKLYLDRNK
jgi:hypothetical protein